MGYTYPAESLLLTILSRHPEGMKEYDLMEELRETVPGLFDFGPLHRDLALFRSHFILFHQLHLLRRRLLREERFILHIHCLEIRLVPFSPSSSGSSATSGSSGGAELESHDPMGEYYLDVSNLEGVGEREVEEMLQGFYRRLESWWSREGDLATLGLPADAAMEEVERRYRELALVHHPDRGGDEECFRAIGEAVARLRDARFNKVRG